MTPEREVFEAWNDSNGTRHIPEMGYESEIIDYAVLAWQASRAQAIEDIREIWKNSVSMQGFEIKLMKLK